MDHRDSFLKKPTAGSPELSPLGVQPPRGLRAAVQISSSVRSTDASDAWLENEQKHRRGFGVRVVVHHGSGSLSILRPPQRNECDRKRISSERRCNRQFWRYGKSTGPHNLHYEERHLGRPPTFRPAIFFHSTENQVQTASNRFESLDG